MSQNDNEPIDITSVDIDGYTEKQIEIALTAINKTYGAVLYGNNFLIMKLNEDPIKFLTVETFYTSLSHRLILRKDKKPIELAKRWMQWTRRREYDDVVFYPGDTSNRNVYNLWKGFAFVPSNKGSCALFLDHIRVNICGENEANYNWVLDWMADAVQKPWRKNFTAILLESPEEGTGKGFFAKHFGKLFGSHYAAFNKPKQVLGQFNAHLEDKMMIFLDEGAIADSESYAYAKSMITEPTINIEPKGKSIREVASYHRIIMASNERHILKASIHDRRWTVLRVGTKCKNNLKYFDEVEDQLKDGGYGALMYFLMNRKYDENTIKLTIKTDALNAQIDQNLPYHLQWWRSVLNSGKFGDADWPLQITTKDFYNSYIHWCERMKVNKREGDDWLTRRLNEGGGLSLGRKNGCYDLPLLSEARELFTEKLGYLISWEE